LGIGDDIMATGMARGAAARGKRIAFGDGRRLLWGPFSAEAFRNNPNIATRVESNTEWIAYHKGNRIYNRYDAPRRRWIWNCDFKAPRGELFFDGAEMSQCRLRAGAVLIEPNMPWHKPITQNKDWGLANYQELADKLRKAGWRVLQTSYGKRRLERVERIQTETFRQVATLLTGIDLAIVPEGGLHHAAAAVGTRAIVIFGGVIPPAVLGYPSHINFGADDACGKLDACDHCRRVLQSIEVDHVYALADAELYQKNSATSAGIDRVPRFHPKGGHPVLS
jgi:ADP-heptose:LPS heptosyltransferase